MTDIVQRLRELGAEIGTDYEVAMWEAADEIWRLRARLDAIAKHPDTPLLLKQYALGNLE